MQPQLRHSLPSAVTVEVYGADYQGLTVAVLVPGGRARIAAGGVTRRGGGGHGGHPEGEGRLLEGVVVGVVEIIIERGSLGS